MRPNIVYMHSHDTGRWVEPMGHAVSMPRLSGLAEEGVLFCGAFAAAPTCGPSRTALLSGQTPHAVQCYGQVGRGMSAFDPRLHLAHTLRDAGYRTAVVGIEHSVPGRCLHDAGYEMVHGDFAEREPDARAAAFIEQASHGDRPFFLDVGFKETHRDGIGRDGSHGFSGEVSPLGDPERVTVPPALPDCPATRRDLADFGAAAERLDTRIGNVLDALDCAGVAGHTLVVCTTDHGPPFPDMKSTLRDDGIGVFLVMRGPGGFEGGRVIDALVSHLDLFPTLCDVAGIEPPSRLEGARLGPLVRGDVEASHEAVFASTNSHAVIDPHRCVRTPTHKYIRSFAARETRIVANTDDSVTKDAWLASGASEERYERERLYDLVADPHETRNLIGDVSYENVLADLRRRLDAWMNATGDPLLAGRLPVPESARLNSPDARSPHDPTVPRDKLD